MHFEKYLPVSCLILVVKTFYGIFIFLCVKELNEVNILAQKIVCVSIYIDANISLKLKLSIIWKYDSIIDE